ncbi:MAG: AsmA-like C-terminal region-containing protein [Hyphomicrobium sp.]
MANIRLWSRGLQKASHKRAKGGTPSSFKSSLVEFSKRGFLKRKISDDKFQSSFTIFRFFARLILIFAPVMLFTLIAGGVAYVRLLHAPVSLKLLSEKIEKSITSQFEGLTAKIDTALLQQSNKGGIEFKLVNLRLLDEDGKAVASAPFAEVSMDWTKLLFLKVVPRRVDFVNPKISLVYSKQEGLALSFANPSVDQSYEVPQSSQPKKNLGNDKTTISSATPVAKINLARALTDFTAGVRRSDNSPSAISEIGFREALVDIDCEGAKSQLKISDLQIDLDHQHRSSNISLSANIESEQGPWSLLLATEDSDQTGLLSLKASFKDFVPKSISNLFPRLHLLSIFEMPLSGRSKFELKTSGELNRAEIALNAGKGQINIGPSLATPFLVDSGEFSLNYDALREVIDFYPSTLKWGKSYVTLVGKISNESPNGAPTSWIYNFESKGGMMAAEEFGNTSAPIESFLASGRIRPDVGSIELSTAALRSAGASMTFRGQFVVGDEKTAGVRLEGNLSNGNSSLVKAFWPRMVSPRAREWSSSHLLSAQALNGQMKYNSGIFSEENAEKTVLNKAKLKEYVLFELKGENVEFIPWNKAQTVLAPDVSVRMENYNVEISVPEAFILNESAKDVVLKGGRFIANQIGSSLPNGTISFGIQSTYAQTLEALRLMHFSGMDKVNLSSDFMDGNFDGVFNISLPLSSEINPDYLMVEGKAKITNLKTKEKQGLINLQSGIVDVILDNKGIKAKGDLLINGVGAKIDWHQSMSGTETNTSPFEITTVLDRTDRNQLGIDVDDFIQGDIPITLRFSEKEKSDSNIPSIYILADLTTVELTFADLAWRKPRGRPAKLQFQVVNGKSYKTELQNFKITGDQIAIDGWVGLGQDQKPTEFNFHTFSTNLVSRLQVQGKKNISNIWDIKARGSTFDGKDFFRSLFSFNSTSDVSRSPKPKNGGSDVSVEIENLLGHSDVSVRGFRLHSSQRGDRLTKLEAFGTLDGGKPLSVQLVNQQGTSRIIYAESTDAGQALRLVGFYPNVQNGRVRLDVDLDGRGAAEKTGVLWIENFKVLGDPVVSEVFSGIDGDGPAIGSVASGERRLVREVFEFDRLRMPFSVGYGQFVIEESYLKGPIVGATLRGKLDYTAERINLGGTYIPLQGLNNALAGIPVLGQILSGPRREGIFGITFALQGPMSRPQVIVNPFSAVAPGIFREMFQMTVPNAAVLPREQFPKQFNSNPKTPQTLSKGQKPNGSFPKIDGWSSDTLVPTYRN